jgi:hypothetical protein
MAWIKGNQYKFDRYFIMLTPDKEGVYAITDPEDKPIYIGHGNLYSRLIIHFRGFDQVDDCIYKHNPAYFYYEECSDSEKKEKELLKEFSTYCNEET